MNPLQRQSRSRASHPIPAMPVIDAVTQRFLLMDRVADLLIAKALAGEYWPELYDRVEILLASLPLTAGEFALAIRRVRNAMRHSERCEFGHAASELRMLRGHLAVLP